MTRDIYNTPWRKMSTALYAPPNEGKVYGTLEVDITKTLVFVQQSRKNGQQITVTHCVAAALGRALFYAVPEVNAYIHRGNIVPRDDVIVSVAVNMSRGQICPISVFIKRIPKPCMKSGKKFAPKPPLPEREPKVKPYEISIPYPKFHGLFGAGHSY